MTMTHFISRGVKMIKQIEVWINWGYIVCTLSTVCIFHVAAMDIIPTIDIVPNPHSHELPPLSIKSPRYTSFDDLIKNKARFLRYLVAIEFNGKFCPQLQNAKKTLHSELLMPGTAEKLEEQGDKVTEFVQSIRSSGDTCRRLRQVIDNAHVSDALKDTIALYSGFEDVVNIYFLDTEAGKYITLLHYVLIQAKKNKIYAPHAVGHMKIFLQLKANPNAADSSGGACPLHYAFTTEQVDLLFEFGALCNKKDNLGKTPLMIYARDNLIETVQCLLDANAPINAQDDSGLTALHYAAQKNNSEIVEILLKHGARYDLLDNKCNAPFSRLRKETKETRQVFEQYLQLSICHALKDNDWEKLTYLMNDYPWINYMLDQKNIVDWMVNNGLEKSKSAETFIKKLSYQLFEADVERTKQLIEQGADCNIRAAQSEYTPLFWAVRQNQNENKIELLVQHGALVTEDIKQLIENKKSQTMRVYDIIFKNITPEQKKPKRTTSSKVRQRRVS